MRQLFTICACICILASCGRSTPTGQSSSGQANTTSTASSSRPRDPSEKLQIAVIPKGTSHEFWKSVHAGAENAARELGNVEIIWKGPAQEDDTQSQIAVVKNMITSQVDAICLAPNQSEALIDVVQEANDEGIPVVIFDSGLGAGPEIVSYVATNNEQGGRLAAQRMAETLGEKGEVILLRYMAGSQSTEQREAGFLDEIAKYPGIKVVSSDQYGEGYTKTAMDKSLQLLLRFQDEVDGMFAVCESNCNGALEAIEQSGLAKKVKFIAFDPSERLIQGLETGTVHGIVLQDPVAMGYHSVKAAVGKLRGETVKSVIPTGEYMATPENMKTEQFEKLLHPQIHAK